MIRAFDDARDDAAIGVVILTGAGPDAFCSGGDQRVRGNGGYVGDDGVPRLNVLDLQMRIRYLPKPVVAMVAGYAIGGGHVLHLVCDLTIAADNARFGQTGPRVGSFDAGFGSSYLARIVGQKKAREIWFLCRQYDAQQALDMGLVNTVVPLAELEATTLQWCREMLAQSPTALRFLKLAMNADCDGQAGMLEFAGYATLLYYTTDEGREGKDAFLEKRKPDFSQVQARTRDRRRRRRARHVDRRGAAAHAARRRRAGRGRHRVRGARAAASRSGPALAALGGALAIQIGTNFANDVFDAEHGADGPDRLGPMRAVSAGLITARRDEARDDRGVRASPTLLGRLPGRRSPAGRWSRSASRRSPRASRTPAGRGRSATTASATCSCWCSSASSRCAAPRSCSSAACRALAIAAAVPVGALATAILVVNNVRDRATDARAGKRTLAVRFGRRGRARRVRRAARDRLRGAARPRGHRPPVGARCRSPAPRSRSRACAP